MARRVAVYYDPIQLDRNQFFLSSLVAAGGVVGVDVVPIVGSDALRATDVARIDVIIVRSRSLRERLWLKQRVPRVVNSPLLAMLGNDKLAQYLWAQRQGILTPPLYLPGAIGSAWVRKPRWGHGGRSVELMRDHGWFSWTSAMLAQAYLPEAWRDRRHYVVGREIVATVERLATDGMHSNVAMGASARRVRASDDEYRFVKTIIGLLGPGYYGVDVCTGPDGPVLMEIEDVVGSRALYALGHRDHALSVMRWACDDPNEGADPQLEVEPPSDR